MIEWAAVFGAAALITIAIALSLGLRKRDLAAPKEKEQGK